MTKKTTPVIPDKQPKKSLVDLVHNQDPEDLDDGSQGGRPPAEIDWKGVEDYMELGADLTMCAYKGGVHPRTLERRIISRYAGLTFKEVRQIAMTDRKAIALKALMNLVVKGNVRATIFINKAWNNMSDRPKTMNDEDGSDDQSTFKIAFDPHQPPPIDAEFDNVQEDE